MISPEPNTGCHLWMGRVNHAGYGTTRRGGKCVRVHRATWEMVRGLIPEGMHVLHRCDTPSCANVEHLFLGTHAENMADRDRKGRNGHASKACCPRGHPYDEDNTYRNAGRRSCVTCMRASTRAWRARKKGSTNA
jgi:hypothetical protein